MSGVLERFGLTSAEDVDTILKARVSAARRMAEWEELREVALVPRGRFLVDAETDRMFTLYRGETFESGSSSVIIDRPLAFYVDRDGELVFLEVVPGRTWSEHIARQARKLNRARRRPAWMDS